MRVCVLCFDEVPWDLEVDHVQTVHKVNYTRRTKFFEYFWMSKELDQVEEFPRVELIKAALSKTHADRGQNHDG